MASNLVGDSSAVERILMSHATLKPVPPLEPIAMAALEAGRISMEAGANARNVEECVALVARGLGAERVDLRIGYASLAITIGIADSGITRMRNVGRLGVNQRLGQQVWDLAESVGTLHLTVEQTMAELKALAQLSVRHHPWVVALAVGLACAAFGRLLGMDWKGIGPVLLASTLGQYIRHKLLGWRVNGFICAMLVSFLSAVIAGLGAQWAGSGTRAIAMVASILLLVPGVPAVNALSDILEGHPSLGSARVVSVMTTLVFMAAGLWCAQVLVDHWR